jgi:hypothetical protein
MLHLRWRVVGDATERQATGKTVCANTFAARILVLSSPSLGDGITIRSEVKGPLGAFLVRCRAGIFLATARNGPDLKIFPSISF